MDEQRLNAIEENVEALAQGILLYQGRLIANECISRALLRTVLAGSDRDALFDACLKVFAELCRPELKSTESLQAFEHYLREGVDWARATV